MINESPKDWDGSLGHEKVNEKLYPIDKGLSPRYHHTIVNNWPKLKTYFEKIYVLSNQKTPDLL